MQLRVFSSRHPPPLPFPLLPSMDLSRQLRQRTWRDWFGVPPRPRAPRRRGKWRETVRTAGGSPSTRGLHEEEQASALIRGGWLASANESQPVGLQPTPLGFVLASGLA